ncbi:MAG: hypothetical protein GY867_04995 [bacterium]|nr:hypothetical protein [bacterium]
MSTRERLRKQRKASTHIGWPLGLGLGIGFIIGFIPHSLGGGEKLFADWAYFLIAFGLGAVSVLLVWWLAGYKVTRSPETETLLRDR